MSQLSLEDAARAAEEGMTRAVTAAGDEWADAAYRWLVGYLTAHERFFPDDAKRFGCPAPPSGEWRALGSVVRRAARAGLMSRDGWAPRVSGHCSPGPVWVSRIWVGLA